MSKLLFIGNAYNVLGLSYDATERQIIRRSKEITNLLKIGEVPAYDNDLTFDRSIRTLASVNRAQQSLLDDTKRLKEFNFWFIDNTDQSTRALQRLHDRETSDAIKTFRSLFSQRPNDVVALHNLAVAESLAFSVTKQKQYLTSSISSWSKLITKPNVAEQLGKVFSSLDGINIDSQVVNNFYAKLLPGHLSDFYGSMSKDMSDPSVYAAFASKISVSSSQFLTETVGGLLDNISSLADEIDTYKPDLMNAEPDSDDDKDWKELSKESFNEIISLLDRVDESINKVKDLGESVWSAPRCMVVRDRIAEALFELGMSIAIKINVIKGKNDEDYYQVIDILKVSQRIAASGQQKQHLNEGMSTVSELRVYSTVCSRVGNYLNQGKPTAALEVIDANIDNIKIEKWRNNLEAARTYIAENRTKFISSSSYSPENTSKNSSKHSLGGPLKTILEILVTIGAFVVWYLMSDPGGVQKTLDVCSASGIDSSECSEAESKHNTTCTSSGGGYYYERIECKRN